MLKCHTKYYVMPDYLLCGFRLVSKLFDNDNKEPVNAASIDLTSLSVMFCVFSLAVLTCVVVISANFDHLFPACTLWCSRYRRIITIWCGILRNIIIWCSIATWCTLVALMLHHYQLQVNYLMFRCSPRYFEESVAGFFDLNLARVELHLDNHRLYF